MRPRHPGELLRGTKIENMEKKYRVEPNPTILYQPKEALISSRGASSENQIKYLCKSNQIKYLCESNKIIV